MKLSKAGITDTLPPDNILTPLDKILRKKKNMTSSPFLPEAVVISLEG